VQHYKHHNACVWYFNIFNNKKSNPVGKSVKLRW